MADTGEIATLIRRLCDADPEKSRHGRDGNLRAVAPKWFGPACMDWLCISSVRDLCAFACCRATLEDARLGIAVESDDFREHTRRERIAAPCRCASGSGRPGIRAWSFRAACGLDILTTRDPGGTGAIARYLQKFGEGIQQIEINVTDVDRATEILRSRFALEPIYPATRAGADGTRVNFFLAPAPEGKKVLIELVEKPLSRRSFRNYSPLCSSSLATSAVHPVWWLAPSPAPVSPLKYS